MEKEELIQKAKSFENNLETKQIIQKAWKQYEEFLKHFPFRENPENIDLLTPEKIFNPGKSDDYFITFIEHKTKGLGSLRVGSALYALNARDQIDIFKELMRIVVNDSLSISQKIDANWENIKGFGGDKNAAKKIIFLYYPQKILPIFKTDDLEYFCKMLNIDFIKLSYEKYSKPYQNLTIGQKFELLNEILMDYKSKTDIVSSWDNVFFMKFLYSSFPPQRIQFSSRVTKPLYQMGLLFEPQYEQEVVYLFSILHKDLGFPYIIKIRNEFPDAIMMDKNKEQKRIEFEVRASDFLLHKHDTKGCDYIVCWENDLDDDQVENLPEIIELKNAIEEL